MSPSSSPTPAVLVAGAGPVGLLLASELARRGVSLPVIDKLAQPTRQSRAMVVHARSLEMLERVGVAEELISTELRATRAQMHSNGRIAADLGLDSVDSPYPFSVTLAQTDTERILTERLAALGTEVERAVELLDFRLNPLPGRGRRVTSP